MLEIGLKNVMKEVVCEVNTAKTLASGTLEVYATPAMILLVEKTSKELVAPYLEEGLTTVGTKLNIEHISATPIGLEVSCESELSEIDRKRLTFKVTVSDKFGIIGQGTHERFIVNCEKFIQKALLKK